MGMDFDGTAGTHALNRRARETKHNCGLGALQEGFFLGFRCDTTLGTSLADIKC